MKIKNLGFLIAVVIGFGASTVSVVHAGSESSSSSEAYVTLLYGDEFLLGVRVLGKSIRDTGSNKDMVVLASDGVSDFAKRLLQWMVDEKELRIIHYTLGPLKPWDWWTAGLVKPVDLWQNVRDQLEESLPGTGGGKNPNEQLLIKILFVLPLCALLCCYYQSNLQINKDFLSAFGHCSLCSCTKRVYYTFKSGGGIHAYSGISVATSPHVNSNQQFSNGTHSKIPPFLGALSVFFCFVASIVSFALAFIVVPSQVKPWTGLLLTYEWTFTTFFIVFGSYLSVIHRWGNATSNQKGTTSTFEDDSGKGHQRSTSNCDSFTWFYWIGMAFLAILAPSLPSLLGITALFARLGFMVVGTVVLASFMTCASKYLAIRAFVKGLEMS